MVLTQQVLHWMFGFFGSRFHTTMVLTQHVEEYSSDPNVYQFPYHYGSYATAI